MFWKKRKCIVFTDPRALLDVDSFVFKVLSCNSVEAKRSGQTQNLLRKIGQGLCFASKKRVRKMIEKRRKIIFFTIVVEAVAFGGHVSLLKIIHPLGVAVQINQTPVHQNNFVFSLRKIGSN